MPKKKPHHGQPRTPTQIDQLRRLVQENTPTRVIELKLGRSEGAIRSIANVKNISLKPTNQSPYNRRIK